ncbi:MAG: hypothetical protein ACQETH_04390 [Candidatus Rifleibacteriota bacterium]
MPIILGLVLCLAIYIASLSWTMSNLRSRYQQVLKSRQASLLARSAFEHFYLKFKTMQRLRPESIKAIEQADSDEIDKLEGIFCEDIIVPPDNDSSNRKFSYGIKGFKVESVSHEEAVITLEVIAYGSYGGKESTLKRLVRISR